MALIFMLLAFIGYRFAKLSYELRSGGRCYSLDITTRMFENALEYIRISRYGSDLAKRDAFLRANRIAYDQGSFSYTEFSQKAENPAFEGYSDLLFCLGYKRAFIVSTQLKPFLITRQESAVTEGRPANAVYAKLVGGATYILGRQGSESLTITIDERSNF